MVRLFLLAGVLLVLGFAAYAPALEGGPVWDDHLLLTQNPTIERTTPAGAAFLQPFSPFPIYYRPLTALAIRMSVPPGSHPDLRLIHTAALLLHVCVALGIASLARWTGATRLAAYLAAGLFVLYPAFSETVAWMSGIGDLLAAAGLVWSAVLLLGAIRAPRPGSRIAMRVMLASVALAVAVLSKETAVLVPAVLWITLWRGSRNHPQRGRLLVSVGSAWTIILILYAVLRAQAVSPGLGIGSPIDPARAAVVLGSYTQRLFLPVGLDLHPMIDQASGFDVRYLWAAGAISGVLLLAAWSAVARPRAFFGIAWLVVTGVPAWLLVPPSSSLFAERYLYLPSIGLAMTLPALVTDVVRRWLPARSRRGRHRTRRRTYRTILLLLSAGLGLTAFLQTRGRATDWGSEQTILDRSLERDSRNVAIAVNRGFLLRTSGHPAEALALYQQTITAVDTGTPFYRTEHDRTAWTRLLFEAGTLAAEAGRTDEAESDFRRAVESDPTHEGACASLGALLGNEGRFEEAVEVLAPGVAANPGSTLLRNNLAQALMLVGRTVEAREQLRAVLTIDPNDATARARLEQLGDAH